MVARLEHASCGGFGGDHAVVLRLEQRLEHAADAGVVLDDQDAEHRFGHGAVSRIGSVN